MLVKASRPILVQRLGRAHGSSYNENPVDSRATDVTRIHPVAVMYFQNLSNSALAKV